MTNVSARLTILPTRLMFIILPTLLTGVMEVRLLVSLGKTGRWQKLLSGV